MTGPVDPLDALDSATDDVANATRQQQLEDLRTVCATRHGRRVLRRLLEWSGTFRTSFASDPQVMAFHEGRKQLGYFLIAELMEAAPEAYFRLLKDTD